MIYLHCKFYNVIKLNYGGHDRPWQPQFRTEAAAILPSNSLIVLTRLSGPRSRPDWNPRITVLARASNNCEPYTRLLVREGTPT
jgi:hypothetical protein